eukprot:scaffold28842_cov145-Skeletonema_dohrnii-CCMP3373.AAC.2
MMLAASTNIMNSNTTTTTTATNNNGDEDDWLDLDAKMSSILHTQKSQQATTTKTLAARSTTLLTALHNHHTRLLADSSNIQSTLTNSIHKEKQALHNESQELSTQLSAVQELQSTKELLLRSNSEIQTQLATCASNIHECQLEAKEEISTIQTIEARHMKNIPKIKHELTLHAMMTNIKWDYSSADKLRGEVSLNKRGVLREFEIEKEEQGEVEIAERLWGIIEG